MLPGLRFGYPTMHVSGCTLFVIYSVTYERCIAHCSDVDAELLQTQTMPNVDRLGIRIAIFDLNRLVFGAQVRDGYR